MDQKNQRKQRQTRLSKTDISKIVHIDQLVNPKTLEQQADEALCKAYCEYLVERLDNIENQSIGMIQELKQQALKEKQIERLDYMAGIQASLHKWVKCKILSAYYDEVLNVDTDTGLYLTGC